MNVEKLRADVSLLSQTQRERLAYIDYKVFSAASFGGPTWNPDSVSLWPQPRVI